MAAIFKKSSHCHSKDKSMIQLPESQTIAFDFELIKGKYWLWIKDLIEKDFQNRPLKVLDVGGGNGIFADKILAAFPNAEVIVLDCSKHLLGKNIPHPRKKLVLDSIENLQEIFHGVQFDLITVNLVLHHLVGKTYNQSRNNVLEALELFNKLLSEEGRLFVCEYYYNGLIVDSLASRIIYCLTSIRLPLLRKLFCKLGANTAGTGVCFQSCKMWHKTFQNAGFHIIAHDENPPDPLKFAYNAILHIRSAFLGFLWLEKEKKYQQHQKVA